MEPRDNRSQASANVRSALIAGIIAFVVYFIITVLITGFSGNVLLMSLVLGVATFVGTWAIAAIISRIVHRRKR